MVSSQVDHFLPGSDSDKEEKRADSLGTVVRVGRVEAASTEDTPNFNTTNSTLRLSGSTELRTHAVKIGRKRTHVIRAKRWFGNIRCQGPQN